MEKVKFKVGDKVYADNWCHGEIVKIDGEIALIAVDTGIGGACMPFHLSGLSKRATPKIPIQNCPFCGGRGRKFGLKTVDIIHKASFQASVGCEKCNGVMYGFGLTPEDAWNDAINNWNKRKNAI